MPVTTSLEKNNTIVMPYIGYRRDPAEWLSLTPLIQYNMNSESILVSLWKNFNYKKKYYILFQSTYNTNKKIFSESISGTIKLSHGYMIDLIWENLYYKNKFCDNDRFYLLAGWDYRRFVFNAGYSPFSHQGFIANARFKVTQFNWLQLRYDKGMNSVTVSFALQFNQ